MNPQVPSIASIASLRQRLRFSWRLCSRPQPQQFERLIELAQASLLDDLLFLMIGALVIPFGVAGLSAVPVQLVELLLVALALILGLLLWATIAFLYARLLGGRAASLFRSFLYLTSAPLLILLVLAVFVAYVPFIGAWIGIALLLYGHALAALTFRYLAGVGWILSVLGTLATSVVSIGLFQLLATVAYGLLVGTG